MATTNSLIEFRGKMSKYCFYTLNGKQVAREIGSFDRKKYLKASSYKTVRKNNIEFAGGGKIGQALRKALTPYSKSLADPYISARLQMVIKNVIRKEYEKSGKMFFSIQDGKAHLKGFEFNKDKTFDTVFHSKISLKLNKKRNAVALSIPEFKSGVSLKAPAGTTHFRLILVIGTLSNYHFDKRGKRYIPQNASLNGLQGVTVSKEMEVRKMKGIDINLKASLEGSPVLPLTVGMVACVGIEFVQKIGDVYYLSMERNAMKIAEVL